jgi:hypothetical protein
MERSIERGAGWDVHKETVAVCQGRPAREGSRGVPLTR